MVWRLVTCLGFLFVACALSDIVRVELRVSNQMLIERNYTRLARVVNGQFPGPTIKANWGDTLEITVINQMPSSPLAIHYHGQYQKGTHFMDGAGSVSQCPIPPGGQFTYTFKADPPGTTWYHSHFPLQYGDGIWGPLIVYDPEDPYTSEYEEEFVIAVNDWLQVIGDEIYERFANMDFSALHYFSTMINGNSGWDTSKPPSVFNVRAGKTYRLLFIHAGTEFYHRLSLAGHNFTVIAADGKLVKPYVVNALDMYSGYRYDVLVTTDQPPAKYEIRVQIIDHLGVLTDINVSGWWLYEGVSMDSPMIPFDNSSIVVLDEHSLRPFQFPNQQYYDYSLPPKNPISLSRTLELPVTSTPISGLWFTKYLESWRDRQFMMPVLPIPYTKGKSGLAPEMEYTYTDANNNPRKGISRTEMITINSGQVVDMLWQNDGQISVHPNHIHGHSFWVMGQGRGRFSFENSTQLSSINYNSPILRDSVIVSADSWVFVRFVADNPGAWMVHCHNEAHNAFGMGFLFMESVDEWPELPADFPVCWPSPQPSPLPPAPNANNNEGSNSSASSIFAFSLVCLLFVLFV